LSARGQPTSQQSGQQQQQQQQQPRSGLTPLRGVSAITQQAKGGSPRGNQALDSAPVTAAEGRGGGPGAMNADYGATERNGSSPAADCDMPSYSTLYKGAGDAAAVIVASRPMQTPPQKQQQQQHEHPHEHKRQALAGASPSRQQQPAAQDHISSNGVGRTTSAGATGTPGGMRGSVRDVPLRAAVGKAHSTTAARHGGHRQSSTVQGSVCPTMNWNPVEEPSWMPDSRSGAAGGGPLSARQKVTPERERRRATVYGDEDDDEAGASAAAAAAVSPQGGGAGELQTGGKSTLPAMNELFVSLGSCSVPPFGPGHWSRKDLQC
jgi:hypothetical protein